MQPWQQRVVDEKADLTRKIARLTAFLDDPETRLADGDRGRLERQKAAMLEYDAALAERIEHF